MLILALYVLRIIGMNATTCTGTIFLYLAPCCTWFADMSSASDAAHIARIMGSTQIPTPFCSGADWRTVQATIAERNPADDVVGDILSR